MWDRVIIVVGLILLLMLAGIGLGVANYLGLIAISWWWVALCFLVPATMLMMLATLGGLVRWH